MKLSEEPLVLPEEVLVLDALVSALLVELVELVLTCSFEQLTALSTSRAGSSYPKSRCFGMVTLK